MPAAPTTSHEEDSQHGHAGGTAATISSCEENVSRFIAGAVGVEGATALAIIAPIVGRWIQLPSIDIELAATKWEAESVRLPPHVDEEPDAIQTAPRHAGTCGPCQLHSRAQVRPVRGRGSVARRWPAPIGFAPHCRAHPRLCSRPRGRFRSTRPRPRVVLLSTLGTLNAPSLKGGSDEERGRTQG